MVTSQLGNHLVASLDSSGYIKGSNIQSNTFNALNTNDILFQSNNDTYLQYDVSATKLVASKLIQCGGNLNNPRNRHNSTIRFSD